MPNNKKNIKVSKINKNKDKDKKIIEGDLGDVVDKDDLIDRDDFEVVNNEESAENEEKQDKEVEEEIEQGEDEVVVPDEEEEVEELHDEEEKVDETCLYKFNKIKKDDEEGEDDDGELEELSDDEEIMNINKDQFVKQEEREARAVLTKYERVRVLGDRAQQLSLGAKPLILNIENLQPKDIAREELKHGVLPFIIVKTMPDGTREKWKVSELQILN
jgi:DNA-directed RNA polymerase subunit K/omega